MDIFMKLAEQKIEEAKAKGELDSLPGQGRPIPLNDNEGVPRDLRMAFHILGNAGVAPPEVELMKEIQILKSRLRDDQNLSEAERGQLTLELSQKQSNLSVLKERLAQANSF